MGESQGGNTDRGSEKEVERESEIERGIESESASDCTRGGWEVSCPPLV